MHLIVSDSRVGRLLVACREIVGADLEEAAIQGPAAAEDWAEIMPERMNRLISPTDWKKSHTDIDFHDATKTASRSDK